MSTIVEFEERLNLLTERADIDVYFVNSNNKCKFLDGMFSINSRLDGVRYNLIPERVVTDVPEKVVTDVPETDSVVYKPYRIEDNTYPTKYFKIIEVEGTDEQVELLNNSYIYVIYTELIFYYKITYNNPMYEDFNRIIEKIGFNKITNIYHLLESYFNRRNAAILN